MFPLRTSLFLFLILFSSPFNPILATWTASCYRQGPSLGRDWSGNPMPAIDPADCATAIALIPDGTISITGALSKPLNFSVSPLARRPYRIPAVFHSGTCIVTVDPAWRLLASAKDRAPENAASLMYFKVWPDVRRGAEEVLKQCLVWKYAFNAGFVGLSWKEGGLHWSFHVFVMPAPRDMPGDGRVLERHPRKGVQDGRVYRVHAA